MPEQDLSYKRRFSYPDMVADLRGFVHEPWASEVDVSSLERVQGSFPTDDMRGRETDVIWRARCGRAWMYVYLSIASSAPFSDEVRTRLHSADAGALLDWGERLLDATCIEEVFG